MIRFCSECGSERISFEIPRGETTKRYICSNCGKIHYINPRIVVGCLPVYEDKVLICRRAIEPCIGTWNLPAGYLEINETVEEGAIRETWEEANAEVKIIRLHCIYSIPHVNQVYLFFLAELNHLNFWPGDETSEIKLFGQDDMPWHDIGFDSSIYAIKKYYENLNNGFSGTHIGRHAGDHKL
jgi:ADP-ribose pyrophosphatase YjhB (NUDIX family)